ncbi:MULTISPECIES: CPBP family intramembrane glutamic endopeptidase [Halorussus]|uniref:CPBP family intramembrane glutamic endopeptidase n=1 Tax=Halorussus TaxID=1070314 RepID=UPI00209FA3F2|nr:type II CAAX endopeptidase family protein [Halorussus vallis]USZ73941.1 CPBP family intramembrane metalloprotease [Halorussus vallis]
MGSIARRLAAVIVAVALVVTASIVGGVFLLVGLGATVAVLDLAGSVAAVIALSEFGFVVTGVAFLLVTGRGLAYLDVRAPTKRDLAWAAVGTLVLLGIRAVGGFLLGAAGVSLGGRGLGGLADRGLLEALLVLVPLSVLVVGPAEELLFRNVIQKYLAESFSRRGAILVASVLFAVVHLPNALIAGLDAAGAAGVLALLFCISVALGAMYDWTGNLFAPVVAHGLYDAVLFAAAYLSLVGGRLA